MNEMCLSTGHVLSQIFVQTKAIRWVGPNPQKLEVMSWQIVSFDGNMGSRAHKLKEIKTLLYSHIYIYTHIVRHVMLNTNIYSIWPNTIKGDGEVLNVTGGLNGPWEGNRKALSSKGRH